MHEQLYSLNDIMFFIGFCVFAIVSIFLIIALINIINFVKSVSEIINSNKDNIQCVLNELPSTIKNVNEVTVNVKEGLEKAEKVMDNVGSSVTDTVSAVTTSTENIVNIVEVMVAAIKAAANAFGKK
jgi:predicted PurR-regulated permease PerM